MLPFIGPKFINSALGEKKESTEASRCQPLVRSEGRREPLETSIGNLSLRDGDRPLPCRFLSSSVVTTRRERQPPGLTRHHHVPLPLHTPRPPKFARPSRDELAPTDSGGRYEKAAEPAGWPRASAPHVQPRSSLPERQGMQLALY
jgi:hypothetical protein